MSDQQSPSHLDEAIDRAVQRIVEVEPPPGLEGRVRARLAAPVRRGLPFSMGWAAAAAMLTLVLAAGVLLREQRDAAPGTPAVLSSRGPARASAEVDGPRAGQAAPSVDEMPGLNAVPHPAAPEATAPPPLEAKARKADRLDEREMAVTGSPSTAAPGAAAPQTAQAAVAPPASVPASASRLAPSSVAAPRGASAGTDTAAAARPSTTAAASGLASRSRAAVAATPMFGTAFDANEAVTAAGGAANAAGAAAKGSADRLEISPLRLPPLRIDPLTMAPIPDTDRQP